MVWKTEKIIQNAKTQKYLETCQNLRYALRPEVSNPSGSMVSTLFCKAKWAKKLFLKNGNFRPLPKKNVQIWDHFFPLLFPKGYESLKIFYIQLWEMGTKRPLNGTSKVNRRTDRQTDTQTDRQTDISTYRKHWPRGPMLWKGSLYLTLSVIPWGRCAPRGSRICLGTSHWQCQCPCQCQYFGHKTSIKGFRKENYVFLIECLP